MIDILILISISQMPIDKLPIMPGKTYKPLEVTGNYWADYRGGKSGCPPISDSYQCPMDKESSSLISNPLHKKTKVIKNKVKPIFITPFPVATHQQ